MLDTNFKLSWDTYKNNLSDGFSKLQQMQEFVDVTLATGGHFVKAHQNIIAVASPYLKEMMKSTPCQHPVIFLGPISHTVLSFILDYIYTGEVNIPSSVLPAFVEAAKLLHIAGIKDIQLPQINPQVNVNETSTEAVNNIAEDFSSIVTSNTTEDRHDSVVNQGENIYRDNCELTVDPEESPTSQSLDNYKKCDTDLDFENLIIIKKVSICPDKDTEASQDHQLPNSNTENPPKNVVFNDCISEPNENRDKPTASLNIGVSRISKEANENQVIPTTPLYTRSNRGSLQMIMNRYIYNLHHSSFARQKRRWRCINYRKNSCKAYIDTNGEIIISRKNVHTHPFQDREIFKMGGRKQFFTSISEAKDRIHIGNNPNTVEIIDKYTEDQKEHEIYVDLE